MYSTNRNIFPLAINIALASVFLFQSKIHAQGMPENIADNVIPKHSLHLGASSIIVFNALDLTYNMLFKTPRNPNRHIGFSLGFGAHYIYVPDILQAGGEEYSGYFGKSDFILLSGKDNKYFEFTLGILAGKSRYQDQPEYNYNLIFPNVGLGYRAITLKGKGVFRIGGSFPRGFYVTYGINL